MKTRLKSYLNEVTNIQNHSVINSKAERTAIRIYETNSSLNHFSNLPLSNFSLMELINVFHNVILSMSSFLYFVTTQNMNSKIDISEEHLIWTASSSFFVVVVFSRTELYYFTRFLCFLRVITSLFFHSTTLYFHSSSTLCLSWPKSKHRHQCSLILFHNTPLTFSVGTC